MQPSSSNSYAQGSTSDNTPIGPQHTPTSHQHVNYWSNVANSHAATYPVYHSTPYYPNNVYGTSYSYQYQYPYSQTHASSQPYWPQQYTGYSQPATSQFSHSNTMAPQITKSELNASSSTASNTNARSQRDASSAPAPAGCNIWAQRQISTVQSLDESKLSKAQKEIYEIVAKSKVNGTLWTKDWDLEPEIPCVQRLRRAFAGGEPDESSSAKNDAVVDEREPKSSTIDTLQHSSPEYSAFTPVYIPKKTSSAPFSSMPVYSTTATATTSTNAASKSSGSFEPSVPPSVQAWAQKQYEACAGNPAETKAVSREIFDRVREATLSNTLWTRDWTLEPPCATAQKYFGPSSAFVGATLTNFASVTASLRHEGYAISHQDSSYNTKSMSDHSNLSNYSNGTDKFGRSLPPSRAGPTHGMDPTSNNVPHWRRSQDVLERRRDRFGAHDPSPDRASQKRKRSHRSSNPNANDIHNNSYSLSPHRPPTSMDLPKPIDTVIVGECMTVEKDFYRLLEQPKPENVRPIPVLKKALQLVLERKAEGAKPIYLWSQLKSIRQDLSIQGVNTDFTIEVYETHARVAIEHQDVAEFAACLTQLKSLYAKGLPGCHIEFAAYDILYSLCTNDPIDVSTFLRKFAVNPSKYRDSSNVGSTDKRPLPRLHPWISHALQVVTASNMQDWCRVFALRNQAPNLSGYVIDVLTHRRRIKALQILAKTVRTPVPLEDMLKSLGFRDVDEAESFITNCHGVVTSESEDATLMSIANNKSNAIPTKYFDTRASESRIVAVREPTREEMEWEAQHLVLLSDRIVS